MSTYSVLLFVHLLAAFLMIGGNVVVRFALVLMRSASTYVEVAGAYRMYALAPRLVAPSVLATVVSGLVFSWYDGFLWEPWSWGSVVLWIVLNVWRAIVVVPPAKSLSAVAEKALADPTAHLAALLEAARSSRLNLGHWGMELVNLVIIVLMVFKPS